jgi:uncharacterized protein (DUF58 family)
VNWHRQDHGRQARRGAVVVGLLLLAFVTRQPAIVTLAAPLGMAWWLGARDRPPRGSFTARFEAAGMLEHDRVPVVVTASGLDRPVQVTVGVTHQLARDPDIATMHPGRPHADLLLVPRRWGAARLGPVAVRANTPSGVVWEAVVPVVHDHVAADGHGRIVVPVHPRLDVMDTMPRATETMPTPGAHTSRRSARGIEFADLRPGQPGDHFRDINWRVTARRGELWVSQRHPEQRQDVVLLVDTFDGHVLPDAVRMAYALVAAYLAQRDRVGVIGFGGVLQWVAPGGGARHRHRVEAALIASQAAVSAAWRDLRIVPPRTLPPHALVVAMTPLREERTVRAMLDLLARGRQVAVIDVAERLAAPSDDLLLAGLDRIQRQTEHDRLRQLGATVVAWADDETPQGVVARAAVRQRQRLRA